MNKSLHFKVTDPLNLKDTETETFGCRHKDPDFCKFIDNKDICAFVRVDSVCKKPSSTWKKYFKKLADTIQ